MTIYALTWITYIVVGAIYMAILYTYFVSAFDMRYGFRGTVGAYVLIYLVDILFLYINSAIANIVTSVIIFGVLIYLCIGSLKIRISSAIFIYLAAFLADYLTAYTIVFFKGISIDGIKFGTPEFLYGLLISKILLAVFAKLLLNITKQRQLPKMTTLHWIALIITPVGSIFVLHDFLFLHAHISPDIADITSSIIIVIINFIVINVYDKILADYETSVKNKLLEEQVKYYSYHSFLAEASEKLIRKTKHDIKYLLVSFQSDIKNNKVDDVEKRITELLGDIHSLDGPAKTGNIAIDAIINFKSDIARQRRISFSLELNIPEDLEIDSSVTCSILGNALDNAVEATDKVKDPSKRIIQICMSYKQESLFIRIVNPFDGKIITNAKGQILSAKRNFHEEGIGLQSIKSSLRDNCGNVEVKYKNNEFCISILLYRIKTREENPAL